MALVPGTARAGCGPRDDAAAPLLDARRLGPDCGPGDETNANGSRCRVDPMIRRSRIPVEGDPIEGSRAEKAERWAARHRPETSVAVEGGIRHGQMRCLR